MADGAWHTAEDIAGATGVARAQIAPRLFIERQKRHHTVKLRTGPRVPHRNGRPPSEYCLILNRRAAADGRSRRGARMRELVLTAVTPLVEGGMSTKQIAFELGVSPNAAQLLLHRVGLQAAAEKRQRYCCVAHNRMENNLVARERKRAARAKRRYVKICDVCERTFTTKNKKKRACGKKCRLMKASIKTKLRRATKKGYVA